MIENSFYGHVEFPNTKDVFPVCMMTYGQGTTQKTFELILPIAKANVPDNAIILTCTSPDLEGTVWELKVSAAEKYVGDPDHLWILATGTLVKGSFTPQKVRHGEVCEAALADA